jgi:serine/threonine-protein kinase
MAARLSHPNIVPIYSVDEKNGMAFFVMALVEGESLASLLARTPRLPIPSVRRILHDVADALAYAHQHGVIHRDIKPDNILLDAETGRPMVTDFGIARAAETDGQLTVTGIAIGTPAYMSPEQSLGERELDGRSDVYSLGVVGYQMLAGELPFKASNTPAMMMKHVGTIPLPIRERRADTPPALARAVDRSLAKRPEDRWATAGDFRDAVESRDEAAQSWQHPAPEPAAPQRREPDWSGSPLGLAPPPLPIPALPPVQVLPYALSRRDRNRLRREGFEDVIDAALRGQPIERRIMRFRRSIASTGFTIVLLTTINIVTWRHFPWFIFPSAAMTLGLWRQWTRLWSEGVTWDQIFGAKAVKSLEEARKAGPGAPKLPGAPAKPDTEALAATLAPAEVLAGPHGAAVRRAAADRATVLSVVSSLAKADSDLIPDVVPTTNALAERVGAVAQLLHHLDAGSSQSGLAELDARIAAVKAEPQSSTDRERRLSLLERQRTSRAELGTRRAKLMSQIESAGIALENLKFDLLKLRSSGVQAAMGDVASATIEARALSKEIGHVLEAADEIRDM